MRLKQYIAESKIIKFTNKPLGIEAEVEDRGDGWAVTLFDLDSDEVVGRYLRFKSKQLAIKKAKELVA